MGRVKGVTSTGPVRSARLPLPLDEWLESRLTNHPHRSSSEILVELIHGGLRLRDGYMAIHRRALEGHAGDETACQWYLACIQDTFGSEYTDHLLRWLAADGIVLKSKTSTT